MAYCSHRLHVNKTGPIPRKSSITIGTAGGVLSASLYNLFNMLGYSKVNSCLTINLATQPAGNLLLRAGPSRQAQRASFFQELTSAKLADTSPWIVCGDSNVTYQLKEK